MAPAKVYKEKDANKNILKNYKKRGRNSMQIIQNDKIKESVYIETLDNGMKIKRSP